MKLIWAGAAVYLGLNVALFPKWTVDDAYILFRYARNLVETGQLTWNPGHEAVEGYTGIALVLLVAVAMKLGISPVVASQGIGVVGFVATTVLLSRFLRRLEVIPPVRNAVLVLHVVAPLFIPIAFAGLVRPEGALLGG
ncbi:MAG TPA: hypothetical protein VLK28_12560 [Methylomirabilota bacterium]|nr:hypothetical protein [Methylomirabilota bacterium]